MKYIFILNDRADKRGNEAEVMRQLDGLDIEYSVYKTYGIGDATRYVNLHCDLNPKDEVCFVAVGGSGTANEVASAIVGRENKSMAILALSGTCDFVKCFPDRDFKSIAAIVEGEQKKIDVIKVNDNYSINVINIGMDAMVSYYAELFESEDMKDSYRKGLVRAVLLHRFNRIKIVADGTVMNLRKRILLGTVANGKYCGGEYLCAPNASVDDGWMEVCVFRTITLLTFLRILPSYREGRHIEDKYSRQFLKYKRAKHVEVTSKDLFQISLDGENIASTRFTMDIIDKALNFVLPKQ